LKDGTNGFERVLPGAERMYPDTDLPPMEITESRLMAIRAKLPVPFWDREARYRKMGLPADVIIPICRSRRVDLFDNIVEKLHIKPVFASVVLCQRFKAFRRAGLRLDSLTETEIYDVFKAHAAGQLAREGVVEVFARILKHYAETAPGEARVAAALRDIAGPGLLKPGDLEPMIAQAIQTADNALFPTPEKKYRFLMGKLMKALVGRAEGKRVAELLSAKLRLRMDGEKNRQEVRA
jgi:glutamyl-tRNA(Gln) amidotransferase subunit E